MKGILVFGIGFGIILLAVLIVYYFSASREKHEVPFRESRAWIHGGSGYLLLLLSSTMSVINRFEILYVFLLTTLFLSLYTLNYFIRIPTIIPTKFYLSLELFCILWVLYCHQQQYEFVQTILPIIMIQGMAFFFIGLMYFLNEEIDITLRNLVGILFVILALVKLLYLLDIENYSIYLLVISIIDLAVYIIIGFVLITIDYSRNCSHSSNSNREMLSVLKAVPMGIITLNYRGDILTMNDRVKEGLLLSEFNEYVNDSINVHELSRLPFDEEWEKIVREISAGESYSLEADIIINSEAKSFEFLFMPYHREEEAVEIIRQNTIVCLVLDHKRQYNIINNIKPSPEDFEMPNKYKLMELFDIGIHKRMMHRFGIILIKIVNFDSITNIINAHETSAIDHLIKNKLEKLDFIYCIGKVSGDTFEVITNDVYEHAEVLEYIQYIKDILNHQSFYDNQMNVYSLDYCIGVAMAPEDGFTQRELLRNASIATAKASAQEKGYVQFYNEHIKHEIASKLQLESKLRDSIVNNELFLEYQPQMSTLTGEIRGFEALVRWKMPDGRILPPNDFIPIAETMGLMDELGEWVLREGCRVASVWNLQHHKNWILSVNVSISQIEQEGFADSLLNILKEFHYPTEFLEVEVTETKMAKSSDRVFIELRRLQEHGVKVAIDDFGTGYSSLEYLRWLPFDVLKIDKGFIERLADNEIDIAIVNSVIELVEKMKLETIAEGVETREQLEHLRTTGCNYVQGFVYSRPMSEDAILDTIDENTFFELKADRIDEI